jgi:CubicO group peptidase (beta-lactamase class C family)
MKPRSLSTIVLLLALAVMAPIANTAGPAVSLPDTGPGRVAAAYFAAFNSGRDEALRAFYEANVSKEGLAQRPVEQRLEVNRQMREEHGTFTPMRIVESADDHLRLIVRTAHDLSLDMTLLFEPGPGSHLAGIRVQDVGADREEPEAGPAPPPGETAALAAWDARLDSLSAAGAFSGAVLVAKGDSVLLRTAYGLASRADRRPNRADTRFNLGSINKIFTKLAIGQLVEQGKVRLDDTIDRYLPDYPKPVASKVTVRQLLEHRGGIADIFGESYDRADRSKLRSVADWIPLFRDKPLAFEPGTKSEYSNGGYVLLGAIVEKASGEDYYDYVRRHIYAPLGMGSTDHYAGDQNVANLATGYTRDRGDGARPDASGLSDNAFSRPMRGSPAGGGYSTLDDLLRFTRAIRAGTLLRAETRRDGFAELGPGPGGEAGLGIGGGAPGLNAAVEMSGPYTILVLANLDPPTAERAASQLRRWLVPGGGGERRIIGGPGGAVGERRIIGGPGGAVGERRIIGGPDGGEPGGAGAHRLMMHAGERAGEAPEHTRIPEGGVDVEMLRNGHLPAVRLMVNGQGPFLFAIDTGGMGSARLDSALVAKLGLESVGQARAGDPSGKNMRLMDLVHVQSIEIGGARFENMTAAVRSYNERRLGEPIDGVLGFGLFKECLFTLDYPGNRVRIERGELPPVDGREVIAFTAERGIPSIRLQVDSLWVDADVDAGSMGGFALPASLAPRLPLASQPRVIGRGRTVSNEFEIKAAELKGSVHLGGHEFPGATVEFQPLFPMANVGSRVLRDFRVTFDQKNRRMRLTRGT